MPEYASESEVESAGKHVRSLLGALNEVIFGQQQLTEHVVTGLLARGHILLEGLPGLGKTELVKGLSKTLGLDTKRVQFTPDLLPGDITGQSRSSRIQRQERVRLSARTALHKSSSCR